MNPSTILSALLPLVPAGYRTVAGIVLFLLGTIGGALANPELAGVLPGALGKFMPLIQSWGLAAAALGLRAAKPETK